MTAAAGPPEAKAPRLAHEIANFHTPICVAWARGSRRSLMALQAVSWPPASIEVGVTVVSEALMGLQALERAVRSARWITANRDEARVSLAAELARSGHSLNDLDTYHWRLWRLRNRVLEHLDEKFFEGNLSSIEVGAVGLQLSDGHAFGFTEWRGWLDVIEGWADALVRAPLPPGTALGREPVKIRDPAPPMAT